ncbi:MAG: DUF2851 family protein [Bacteroidales bacterium]|nr:DUF2851 family protein [Bacteroidales bacterium]
MKKINEEFLHFLWKNQFLTGVTLTSPENQKICVTDPGFQNKNAGPDFLNARIEIDDTTWAGNVELHINASDWFRHRHQEDDAYDSVILHVVYFNDAEVSRSTGELIPAAILRFPSLMWDNFRELQLKKKWIPCQDLIRNISALQKAQWTSSLMAEKLMKITGMIATNMKDLKGQHDAIFSRIIFRSFGLPVNTTPFEMLSLTIPYPVLLRNKNSAFTLESLLFGQSGMLDSVISHDKYTEGLKHEFQRHSGKLRDINVPAQSWKFLRMRPASFPTVRLAQLASFISKLYPPHQIIESLPEIKELYHLLRVRAGDYWNTHYLPGKESASSRKYLGKHFISNLLINAIVPYVFYYGKISGRQKYCDYGLYILEHISAEDNAITKKWNKFGMNSCNAFESQALLFLYKNYCSSDRCLDCQFGNNLIIHGPNKK